MHLPKSYNRSIEFLFVTRFLSGLSSVPECTGFIQCCNEPVDCRNYYMLRFLFREDPLLLFRVSRIQKPSRVRWILHSLSI